MRIKYFTWHKLDCVRRGLGIGSRTDLRSVPITQHADRLRYMDVKQIAFC